MSKDYEASYCSDYTENVGTIHHGLACRAGGKKILEWSFTFSATKERVKIPVNILHAEEATRRSPSKPMRFRAYIEKFSRSIEDSNIDNLYKLVFDYLIDREQEATQIVWEDWLEVSVSGNQSDLLDTSRERQYTSGLGADMKIEVNRIKRGIYKGKDVTLHRNNVAVKFPKPTCINDVSDDKYSIRSFSETSYIPATEENIQALRTIQQQMIQTKLKLALLLSSDEIIETLPKISNNLSLLTFKESDE